MATSVNYSKFSYRQVSVEEAALKLFLLGIMKYFVENGRVFMYFSDTEVHWKY